MSIFQKLQELRGTDLKSPLFDISIEMLDYDPDLLPADKRQAEICRFILIGWRECYRASRQLVKLGLITQEEADRAEEYCREKFS